jgi:hypothetical protein
MRVIISIFLCVFIIGGIAYAIDIDPWTGKLYGGYTVLFNAENYEGLVFANSKKVLVLVVAYPSTNRCYLYSDEGQFVLNYDTITQILKTSFGAILDSTVARIQPVK